MNTVTMLRVGGTPPESGLPWPTPPSTKGQVVYSCSGLLSLRHSESLVALSR